MSAAIAEEPPKATTSPKPAKTQKILFPGFSNVNTQPKTAVFRAMQAPHGYDLSIYPIVDEPASLENCALIVTDMPHQVFVYNELSGGRIPILFIGDRQALEKLGPQYLKLSHIHTLKPHKGEVQLGNPGELFAPTTYSESLVQRINDKIARILRIDAERKNRAGERSSK